MFDRIRSETGTQVERSRGIANPIERVLGTQRGTYSPSGYGYRVYRPVPNTRRTDDPISGTVPAIAVERLDAGRARAAVSQTYGRSTIPAGSRARGKSARGKSHASPCFSLDSRSGVS
jgi:hypothetical protein